jgi:hypothetical protein
MASEQGSALFCWVFQKLSLVAACTVVLVIQDYSRHQEPSASGFWLLVQPSNQ